MNNLLEELSKFDSDKNILSPEIGSTMKKIDYIHFRNEGPSNSGGATIAIEPDSVQEKLLSSLDRTDTFVYTTMSAGFSLCAEGDNYNKKVGREVSLKRLKNTEVFLDKLEESRDGDVVSFLMRINFGLTPYSDLYLKYIPVLIYNKKHKKVWFATPNKSIEIMESYNESRTLASRLLRFILGGMACNEVVRK